MINIDGKRYRFEIAITNHRKLCGFSITAIDKKSLRYSSINNLNAILSLFGIEHISPRYEDSKWPLHRSEAERHSRVMADALGNEDYLLYLEEKLDEDRFHGEWENRIRKTKGKSL
jgi:hypothetical protein